MSAIKPPGGNSPSELAKAAAERAQRELESSEANRSEASAGAAQATGDPREAARAVGGETGATQAGGETGALAPLDALAADLDAGRVDPETALERLVQRALEDVGAGLSAGERTELETTLRAALRDDPTLVALRERWQGG